MEEEAESKKTRWYWELVGGVMTLIILIGGVWVALQDTTEEPPYDICQVGKDYGIWYNVSEIINVDKEHSAVGKYRCDIENKEMYCSRTTNTRCYMMIEVPMKITDSYTEYMDSEKGKYKISENSVDYDLGNGKHNVIIGGEANVKDKEGLWKKVSDAKEFDIPFTYIGQDPEYEILNITGNLTWLRFETFTKDENAKIKWCMKEKCNYKEVGSGRKTTDIFVDYIYGNEYSFGGNSTTIVITTPNTGNLDDTYIETYYGTADRGAIGLAKELSYSSNAKKREYISKWNLSDIPDGVTIESAILSVRIGSNYLDAGESLTVKSHHIYNSSIYTISGSEWTEGDSYSDSGCTGNELCWNTRPSSSTYYNTTGEGSQTITSGTTGFKNWTVTQMVTRELNSGSKKVSIWMIATIASGSPSYSDHFTIATKEHDTANRPILYVTYTLPDTIPPTYSEVSHNTTSAGASVKFSVKWNDDTALHPAGQYIFSTNNTGSWVNDSAVNFTATPQYANVSKVLNSTVGKSIGYRWYAKNNAGNWNSTDINNLVTTEVTDTCSCPTSGDWIGICSDNCTISEDCNLGSNKFRVTGGNGKWIFTAKVISEDVYIDCDTYVDLGLGGGY